MARKTFWIVFSLIVAYACLMFSNFSTSTKLHESLRDKGGNSMPVEAYGNAVIGFYNDNKRWPRPTEIVLPAVPSTGIVRSVRLEPDGVLLLKLRGRIWLRPVEVKVAMLLQPGQDKFGWTSACLDVTPKAITRIIYNHCGQMSLAEVRQSQDKAIQNQAEMQEERVLIAHNKGQETTCHQHAKEAQDSDLVACLTAIDAHTAQQVAQGIDNLAQSPRVTQRQLRLKPNPLEWRNQDCDEKWAMLRNAVLSSHPQARKCFVRG